MLGRKKDRRLRDGQIVVLDADGLVLQQCAPGDYVLPEEVVLALSREYFDDPDPCYIHRAAVHKRAMMELMALLPAGQTCSIAGLPDAQQKYFPAGASAVCMEEFR